MIGTAKNSNRERCAFLPFFIAVALLSFACAARAYDPVDSLHYRTTLYYYLQQDYFNALSEVMQAQQLDALGAFSDHAELLRGGASLSYGMTLDARQIFEKLLLAPGTSPDRDRAWFYLGKLAWQSGDLDLAAKALDTMAPAYQGELAPEANFIRASISLRQGRELLAATYETLLPTDSPWLYYLYYNLGAHHAAEKNWELAANYFERVIQSPLSTAEMEALRDQALTASGYTQLATKNYERAASNFARVRLDSPLVERALLGYGWAYSGMGDYRAAITPWQTLTKHDLLNDSAREGLLALAFAHEQLGRHRTALEHYQRAAKVYETQLAGVQAGIRTLRNDDSISPQLDVAGETSQSWLNTPEIVPRGDQPPFLRHLMTRHSFQLALRELRDLHNLARYFSTADQRLRALSDINAGRPGPNSPAAAVPPLPVTESASTERERNILALQKRLHDQQQQIEVALDDARTRVRNLAIAELEKQAEGLQRALGQSRLAVARLYETGTAQVSQ